VPEHGDQQSEAGQYEYPRDDRGRRGDVAVREPGTGGMRDTGGCQPGEHDDQAQPGIQAAGHPGRAQRQHRAASHRQHRVQGQRVDPGQRRGHAGLPGNGVNARVGEHESRRRQEGHSNTDSDQADDPQGTGRARS
jgi:hypothetical protein